MQSRKLFRYGKTTSSLWRNSPMYGSTRSIPRPTLGCMARAKRRPREWQRSMWATSAQPPRSACNPFYDPPESCARRCRLRCLRPAAVREVLRRRRRPAEPGAGAATFRMLLLGYFEGLDSERAIAWRAADSLSLPEFLGVALHDASPDHSTGVAHAPAHRPSRRIRGLHVGAAAAEGRRLPEGQDDSPSTPRRWKRTRRCGASSARARMKATKPSFTDWTPRRRTDTPTPAEFAGPPTGRCRRSGPTTTGPIRRLLSGPVAAVPSAGARGRAPTGRVAPTATTAAMRPSPPPAAVWPPRGRSRPFRPRRPPPTRRRWRPRPPPPRRPRRPAARQTEFREHAPSPTWPRTSSRSRGPPAPPAQPASPPAPPRRLPRRRCTRAGLAIFPPRCYDPQDESVATRYAWVSLCGRPHFSACCSSPTPKDSPPRRWRWAS